MSRQDRYIQSFEAAPTRQIPYPAQIAGSRALLGALVGSIFSRKGNRLRGAGHGLLVGGAIGGISALEWLIRKKKYEQDMMEAMKMGSYDDTMSKIAGLDPVARRELVLKTASILKEARFGKILGIGGLIAAPFLVWDYMRAREKGFRQGSQTAIAQMAPVLAAYNLPQGSWSLNQTPTGMA